MTRAVKKPIAPELKGLADKGSPEESGHYWVEWCNNPWAEEKINGRFFEDKTSAKEFTSRKSKKFSSVWFSEYASYRNPRTNGRTLDWIYTWWSTAVEKNPNWGPKPEQGYGIPAEKKYMVPYESIVHEHA